MKLFRTRKRTKKVEINGFIDNAVRQHVHSELETFKLMETRNDLSSENKIPNCFYLKKTCSFRIRTILGQYAHSYMDVLRMTTANPDMTLKEFQELDDIEETIKNLNS